MTHFGSWQVFSKGILSATIQAPKWYETRQVMRTVMRMVQLWSDPTTHCHPAATPQAAASHCPLAEATEDQLNLSIEGTALVRRSSWIS